MVYVYCFNEPEPHPVLHPYYKLAYIKVQWGGPEEQAAEIEAGNLDAKDWQDEAKKIVENTVGLPFFDVILLCYPTLNRWLNIIALVHPPLLVSAHLQRKSTPHPKTLASCRNMTNIVKHFSPVTRRRVGLPNYDATSVPCNAM
jgi:hypothetical protein